MTEEREGIRLIPGTWDPGRGFDYDRNLRLSFKAQFEIDEMPGWRVELSGLHEDASVVISGLRVFPTSRITSPVGGLTTTMLRKIPIESLLWVVRRQLSKDLKTISHYFTSDVQPDEFKKAAWQIIDKPIRASFKRAPKRDDFFYVSVVKAVQKVISQGERAPNRVVGDQLDVDPTRIRNLLQEAKKRGLANPVGKGQKGWTLTKKGHKVRKRKDT